MMKSFFKKLAFVMALAMVITMAAPAAQAAVAEEKALAIGYQNGMAITEVNLANVGDTEDLRFLYAPANWKELGADWTSSNNNVVTVDSNGLVTAVAAGSAIVSVAVGTNTASVTVNVVDLPEYTVTMGTADNRNITEWTLENVDDTIDLAFYGIKDYSRDDIGNGVSRYFCEWDTTDPEVATVDQKGLVTAVAPGKAKITLIVWNLKLGRKINVDSCWITVPEVEAPVVEPEEQNIIPEFNKTQNTIEINLTASADISKTGDVEIFRVFQADDDSDGDGWANDPDSKKGYEQVYVNKVTGSGTAWVAETFEDFVDGVEYEVRVKGYDPETFTASVGDVFTVIVKTLDGASLANEDQQLDPAHVYVELYDKNGVDVTNRVIAGVKNNDPSNVTFFLTDEYATEYTMTGHNEISFYEMATAGVKAKYDGNGVEAESADPEYITPGNNGGYSIEGVIRWTLVAPGAKADWEKPVKEVPAGEYGYTLAVLIEDNRGDYYTTDEDSVGTKYNNKAVKWTEDENEAFWIYGYRIEYRSMDPDKMGIETYGDIASYQKGDARFAVYLYNQQFNSDKEFLGEIYTQYLKVCCEKTMDGMTAVVDKPIVMNTEADEEKSGTVYANAYYSLFSKATLKVNLLDVYHGGNATTNLEEAKFELTLLNDTKNTALAEYVQGIQDTLNGASGAERTFVLEANEIAPLVDAKCTYIKFAVKEKFTGVTRNVTVSLIRPVTEVVNGETCAKVATIDEYLDNLDVPQPYSFEKFALKVGNSNSVDLRIKEFKANVGVNNLQSVLLYQNDKNGYEIGIDNNLYISKVVNPTTSDDIFGAPQLTAGDRVLIVTYNNKPFVINDGINTYDNPAYPVKVPTSASADYSMPANVTGIGVTVATQYGYATSASGDSVDVNRYDFTFSAKAANDEMVYAQNGKYTVTIKTFKEYDTNDKIVWTKSSYLTKSFSFNVTNTNAKVEYAGRDAVTVEGYVDAYNWSGDIAKSNTNYDYANKEYGNDLEVKKLILAAYNFKLGSQSNWAATTDNILYYTYTLTPSNGQVIINEVFFAVPVDAADKGTTAITNGWYRSTATVNKSLTFKAE